MTDLRKILIEFKSETMGFSEAEKLIEEVFKKRNLSSMISKA